MREIIFAAHRRAFEVLHSGPGTFPVGLTLALVDIQAAEGGENMAAEFQRELADVYLEQLHSDDFVGVQTYSRMVVGPQGMVPPANDVEKNQMGEEFYPEAIGGTIRHAAKVAGIPVIVTENGLSSTDDSRRLEYLQRALRCVVNSLEAGIDVLIGLDPVQGAHTDLALTKEKLGRRVCLWGGVSGAVTVERGSEAELRSAVRQAIQTLGPRGFILSPVDNITVDEPLTWQNIVQSDAAQ